MAFSQRELEGYVRIDHRDSPGFSEVEMLQSGMPLVRRGAMFESSTMTCSHCQRIVIMNPKRTRARAHCFGCDHFICDGCEYERVQLSKPCKPMKQIIAEHIEDVIKRETAARQGL